MALLAAWCFEILQEVHYTRQYLVPEEGQAWTDVGGKKRVIKPKRILSP